MRQNIETAILGMIVLWRVLRRHKRQMGVLIKGVEVLLRRANTSIRLPGL